MALDMNSGIYMIFDSQGRFYIGSAVNMQKRWNQHLHYLRHGKHNNGILQRAFDKYGEESFYTRVLSHVPKEELRQEEQDFIDFFEPFYNIAKEARRGPGMEGRKHSEETRRKISESKKGCAGNRKGVKLSEETREKMRQSRNAFVANRKEA